MAVAGPVPCVRKQVMHLGSTYRMLNPSLSST